jgi:hypothetical protein
MKMTHCKIAILALILPLILAGCSYASADETINDWGSVSDLKAFLSSDDTNEWLHLKADTNGNVDLNGRCEVYAYQLRSRAELNGYRLETEILSKSDAIMYQQFLKFDAQLLATNDSHMINKAIIGNEIWFIEPQNDKIWLAYYLE